MSENNTTGSRQSELEARIAAGESVTPADLAAAIAEDAAHARIAELERARDRRAELAEQMAKAEALGDAVKAQIIQLEIEATDGRFEALKKGVETATRDYIVTVKNHNKRIASLRIQAEQARRAKATVLDELAALDGDASYKHTASVNSDTHSAGLVQWGDIEVLEITDAQPEAKRIFHRALELAIR